MNPLSNLTPLEIGRANEHDLRVKWADGRETIYPARFLRLACPCAGCVEEMTGRVMLRDIDVAADVHPLSIHPVGRYAIQILWSDGHNTGLYTWERLHELVGQVSDSPE
jgi:ATP-binding protein involved in chromosome partitioning